MKKLEKFYKAKSASGLGWARTKNKNFWLMQKLAAATGWMDKRLIGERIVATAWWALAEILSFGKIERKNI